MYRLVIPLGITTFVLLVITLLTGLRVIKAKFKTHKRLGIITLISGICHAGLVIYLNYF